MVVMAVTTSVAVGLLWSAVSAMFPLVSAIAVAAAAPLYLIGVRFGGVPTNLFEVLVAALLVGMVVRMAVGLVARGAVCDVRGVLRAGFFSRALQSLWTPIILLVVSLLLALVNVPRDHWVDVFGAVKSWFVVPLVYVFVMQRVVSSRDALRRVLMAYVISALALSVWGIYQWGIDAYVTPDGRVSGPFQSANYLALFIGPAFAYIAIDMWRSARAVGLARGDGLGGGDGLARGARYAILGVIFRVVATIGVGAALYLTRSYGAFLGVGISLIGYGFFAMRDFRRHSLLRGRAWLRFGALVALVIFIGGVFFVTSDPGKFTQMFHTERRSSSSVRLQVWRVAAQLIREHPILGIGARQYEYAYAQRATEILGRAPYEPIMLHPHNLFLMAWLSGGLLGLGSFIWLLILMCMYIRAAARDANADAAALISAIATMFGVIVIHGLVDLPLWKNDLAFIFWLVIGAVMWPSSALAAARTRACAPTAPTMK